MRTRMRNKFLIHAVILIQLWLFFFSMASARCIMYLTGQHPLIPPHLSLLEEITHITLAFLPSSIFNEPNRSSWPLFTTVESVRAQFPKRRQDGSSSSGVKVMVAIGGWGDTEGFEIAARTEEGRKVFARKVGDMVEETGADGVDIDWEYPGGNGEDYKRTPNNSKTWQITAYPLLLQEIRSALGPTKLISAAVPGLPRDMLAFTPQTLPAIAASLDFFNIMTYDLMNRRDTVTKHHTGIQLSIDAVKAYNGNGVSREKTNLGFAFYVKWFRVKPRAQYCAYNDPPLGCPTVLMEDPITGADLGQAGAFSWHDRVPDELNASFSRAMRGVRYDGVGGGAYYWDEEGSIWWSWDTPEAISRKFPRIVRKMGLGGVFAWGLGEDANEWAHLRALTDGVRGNRRLDEGRDADGDVYHQGVLLAKDEL